ncbi:MAG: NAD(P)/FAD-dependent oxidoreductase [Bacillota bacterium]
MKVAVIGAGPAGLACAHELEKNGVIPDVYEKKHKPGELFDHCAAVLELFTRPYDPLEDIRKRFGITIQPLGNIKSIVMKSPRKKVEVKGRLGYFVMRGNGPVSAETQLFKTLKTGIIANTYADYKDLAGKYDYVVVADGGYGSSRKEGIWTLVYPTNLVGSTVLGDFRMDRMYMWIDTRYSKTAYAYLTPMEKKRAFLGLVVPESAPDEAMDRWRLFWEMENFDFKKVNEVIVEHNAGYEYPHQVGNVLFAGIAGGFLDPFLGFGMTSSIKSGVLAGRSIATGKSYEDLICRLKEDMKHSLVLRELFNEADNADLDAILSVISIPGVKHFIYNTNIDIVRLGSAAIAHIKNLAGLVKKMQGF